MILSNAVWRGPCSNNSGLRNSATRGVVFHVNDSVQDVSLWGWVNNSNSDMSCHFQVHQNGTFEQYLDTDWFAWCQADGNAAWISIEMPTIPAVGMTSQQVATGAMIVYQCAVHYGFPLQLTSDPVGTGLGWHGMGGAAWGGHTGCPGDIRRGQLQQVLDAALALKSGKTQGDDELSFLQWPKKDQEALAEAAASAVVNRAMGGVNFKGNLAQMLANTLSQTQMSNSILNGDAQHPGLIVRTAALQAAIDQLPAKVEAAAAKTPGATVDAAAIVKELMHEVRVMLDTADSTGAHSS